MIRNTGAAFGGRPIGSVFLIINIYGYALYIPYIFHIYIYIYIYSIYIYIYIYIFPSYVPYIFPCVFLNLWSQEKTSPYRKTTFLLLFFQILYLLYFYSQFYKCSSELMLKKSLVLIKVIRS